MAIPNYSEREKSGGIRIWDIGFRGFGDEQKPRTSDLGLWISDCGDEQTSDFGFRIVEFLMKRRFTSKFEIRDPQSEIPCISRTYYVRIRTLFSPSSPLNSFYPLVCQ